MEKFLVLVQSLETLEELSALITPDGVGVGVVGPHHVMLEGGVRGEISPTLLAGKFLYPYPFYDLAIQGILLLLEVLSTEVDSPTPRVFPDSLLTERTLVL